MVHQKPGRIVNLPDSRSPQSLLETLALYLTGWLKENLSLDFYFLDLTYPSLLHCEGTSVGFSGNEASEIDCQLWMWNLAGRNLGCGHSRGVMQRDRAAVHQEGTQKQRVLCSF